MPERENPGLKQVAEAVREKIECKPVAEDTENWNRCLAALSRDTYVPWDYKPSVLRYQEAYFAAAYDECMDMSMVLYRGGRPVGIWPVMAFRKEGKLHFGTTGGALLRPLFPFLEKAEGQRAVIESCLDALLSVPELDGLLCAETVLEDGASQWVRKLMERGGMAKPPIWQLFADLALSQDEIQARIRRTNKYSIAKGQDDYDIRIYDETSPDLDEVFGEFHRMHSEIAGRETRPQKTWDIQKEIIRESCHEKGWSFLVFIRDRQSGVLVGSALFNTTPQTGYYCVAAYDRSRFARPVGHIVQAIAMQRMREKGVRWYEIGERFYETDPNTYEKLLAISHYKEGFATHLFPKTFIWLPVAQ